MLNGERIAIVGVGGLLPGPGDLDGFWSNVVAGRDVSSDPPPGRWPVSPQQVFDQRPSQVDRVHSLRGYYLPEFTANLSGLNLGGWPVTELDPVFHVALHIGNSAWKSAVTGPVDRDRCGVILGNIALPTEKTNAIARDVLGPQLGLFAGTEHAHPLNRHATGLPAALIARGLDFGLGGYSLDAACSSSLYAIKLACDELMSGRADAMIAGGLSRPDSMYTQMGFAQLRALSLSGRCSPFDARGDGLVVGEGGCAFVLKRFADALAHGDTIHGLICGIGLSNDVEGNLLLPASEGQLRAMKRAYRRADWRPGDVQLIEGHATGTPTGDAIEFGSYRELWQGESGRAVVGCVKSTVGHLLTGAGSAGVAKVLRAIREKVLPPTANFERPSEKLGYDGQQLRVLRQAEAWESNGPRRAAVSAFGFGGINGHVLIEEYVGQSPGRSERVGPLSPVAIVGVAARAEAPMTELQVPATQFRVPPKELEEMLPQQTLALCVASEAIADAGKRPASGLTTGVFMGISLDPNTSNFHLRWLADNAIKDQVHPPLTANRTMGALGSIAASRVARFLGAGGPSFAVCDEQLGGVRSFSLAVHALQNGELDRAIVGAVDLASDPRAGGTVDGAGALVLKRLDDATRDGDRIYGVVDEVTSIALPPTEPSSAGAASGLLDLVRLCRDLKYPQQSINGRPAYWLNDRATGPRRSTLEDGNIAGYGLRVDLVESPTDHRSSGPLSGRTEGVFLLASDRRDELLDQLRSLRELVNGAPDVVAGHWWRQQRPPANGALRIGIVARTADELLALLGQAESHLRNHPDQALNGPVYYCPRPLGGDLAFVYPGSGNQFPDMGRELGYAFPFVLDRQQRESEWLRSQYHSDAIWGQTSIDDVSPLELIFAQVSLGTMVSDLLTSFGVRPQAALPYSLGESAMLFGTRAWLARDEMFARMEESSLFRSDLAGSCDAARSAWKLDDEQSIDWYTGVVWASPEDVRKAIRPGQRAYLLIINTSADCVIGGQRSDVEDVVRRLGARFLEVTGVSTAHCEVAHPVRSPYWDLHHLPTIVPQDIRYYSGAWGRAYDLNSESAAEAITAAVLDTIDYPRVVEAAYADGVRTFIEVGPGGSCTRMIDSILGDRPHLARAVCVPRQDSVASVLQLLAQLHAEGRSIDLSPLYPADRPIALAPTGPMLQLPVGYRPQPVVNAQPIVTDLPPVAFAQASIMPQSAVMDDPSIATPFTVLANVQTATIQAHDAYLRFATAAQGFFAQSLSWAGTAIGQIDELPADVPVVIDPDAVPRSLDFAQCMEFANGLVGNVLGRQFAEADTFPTRVRLPDGPLQLVDRILTIEGEPKSMTSGRVVTEHHVHADRWYLDAGRIPTCVAVEAGQADLFLSGYLGIDFETRGLACYRLLDATVTFHRPLPSVGETILYDIRIDEFFRQGETFLFRFRFESTVNGEPLLSMRDGCAGFFSEADLAGGKGIVHTAFDRKPIPGVVPDGWAPHVPLQRQSISDDGVDALRRGDLAAAFGPEFRRAKLNRPATLPGGMMRLVHRVEAIEPGAGRYGLGRIRGEADIHPDDWFLTCHFVDDMVMPGTLMYECCMHTLRVLLMRMGWVYEEGEAVCEPVPGITSRLKCRGQVISSTSKVTYEVSLKEIGFRPEPYVLCDALMYADGKPIVEIGNMSLRMTGLTRERLDEIWSGEPLAAPKPLFDRDRITAFAIGKPSVAFGDRYLPFDSDRVIARLPGPPFQFLDRITDIRNCEQWSHVAGGEIIAEYDVPPDAWYFAANRYPRMPFSVLLETALQPCGWLAAYIGSALTSPVDISFRNLGGSATQLMEVGPNIGTLKTRVKIDRVSTSGGMIIQHYTFDMSAQGRQVYVGETTFGFFSKEALANQVGLVGTSLQAPGPVEQAGWSGPVPTDPPFPDQMLRMIDRIDWCTNEGGPHGLGSIQAKATVRPEAWFFKAHFFQDPVWPGSLGLESLLQALQVWAHRRWGAPPRGWQGNALNAKQVWLYRGQILPTDREVTVQGYVSAVDDSRRILTANGLLSVDGRIIYRMADFTLQG